MDWTELEMKLIGGIKPEEDALSKRHAMQIQSCDKLINANRSISHKSSKHSEISHQSF